MFFLLFAISCLLLRDHWNNWQIMLILTHLSILKYVTIVVHRRFFSKFLDFPHKISTKFEITSNCVLLITRVCEYQSIHSTTIETQISRHKLNKLMSQIRFITELTRIHRYYVCAEMFVYDWMMIVSDRKIRFLLSFAQMNEIQCLQLWLFWHISHICFLCLRFAVPHIDIASVTLTLNTPMLDSIGYNCRRVCRGL